MFLPIRPPYSQHHPNLIVIILPQAQAIVLFGKWSSELVLEDVIKDMLIKVH